MTDLGMRRYLWPIVTATLGLPTAGGGIYYAVARSGAPVVEASAEAPSASLDAVAQALAEPPATPAAKEDPLAFMAGLPEQPSAEPAPPASGGRYGTIAPIESNLRYEPAASPESGELTAAVPTEPDFARGQSPTEEAVETVPPLENPLRDEGRYGALPPLPEPPAAMTGESVNPLRPHADTAATPKVEPIEPATPVAETPTAPANPFARSMSAGDTDLPPDPAGIDPSLQAVPMHPEPESPIPGTRSVLVNNRNEEASPPINSMVPIESAASSEYGAAATLAPLGGEVATVGAGKPGERSLEGPQRSGLIVQKFAPAEIQIGKPCKFVVKVRNESNQTATEIVVRDTVPQGTKLINTAPTAEVSGSTVIWEIGSLSPGEERSVELQLEPTEEGQIGSVATVSHAAYASVRTVCTRPQLALKLTAAPQVMVGRQQRVQIELSNPGTGDATGVVLLENVPESMSHAAGSSIEFPIGTLRAGETRQLELMLTAEQPGVVQNRLIARGEGNLQAEEAAQFEVVAPALEVAVEGPRKRFLDRPATYMVNVQNPGTAAAKDVQLVTKLPRGLRFVKANNMGEYDATTHSVHWSLAELPEGERGSVELVAMPVEPGQHALAVEGRASEGLEARHTHEIQIEGLAAIDFEVLDREDPIEIGGETTYEIRITNQGTKAATNVRISASLPPGMNLISATGETNHQVQAGSIVFGPIASLAPKADSVYRLQVQVAQAGDLRLGVEVQTDDLQQPIRKEESTRVFGDE